MIAVAMKDQTAKTVEKKKKKTLYLSMSAHHKNLLLKRNFMFYLMKDFCIPLNIKQTRTTAYHPQPTNLSSGPTELVIR
jgi:hypothetical protein